MTFKQISETEIVQAESKRQLSSDYREALYNQYLAKKILEMGKTQKWLDLYEEASSIVSQYEETIQELGFLDLLDYSSNGGEYKGNNMLNEVQQYCFELERDAFRLSKQRHHKEMGGRVERSNTGWDCDPDIDLYSISNPSSGRYKPMTYRTRGMWCNNVRTLVDVSGEPLGVPKDWRPKEILGGFEKKGYKNVLNKMLVPDRFAIVRNTYSGERVVLHVMEKGNHINDMENVQFREEQGQWSVFAGEYQQTITISPIGPYVINGEVYTCVSRMWAKDKKVIQNGKSVIKSARQIVLDYLKREKIKFVEKYPEEWVRRSHKEKTLENVSFLESGGIPFMGSKQLLNMSLVHAYELKNKRIRKGTKLRWSIKNDWTTGVVDHFIEQLFTGNGVNICKLKKGVGTSTNLQAWKIVKVPIKRRTKTVVKNIVIFTDLRWN